MKVTKAQYDEMPAWMQKNFKLVEGTEDEYSNGEEDAGGLKTALEKERAQTKKLGEAKAQLEKERKEREEREAEEAENGHKKTGDVEKLEKSYREREAKAAQKHAEELAARNSEINRLVKDRAVDDLVSNFTVPDMARSYIEKRVTVEYDSEGKSQIRILAEDGSPSASSLDDFKKEIVADKRFSGIVVASKGSGGGATAPKTTPGGGGATRGDKPANINTAPPSDLVREMEARGVGQG